LFRPVLYGYLCHAETVRRSVWSLMKNLVRWIGVAPGLVCLALVVDLAGSAAVKQWKRERTERETLEAEARQEPYRNQEWGHRYWEEMNRYRERWESYWIYRLSDRHGEFLNVTNGVRSTYLPRGSWPGHSHTVFLFGGSAAWGHGARDQATLASWLARVGEEHGERLDVRNYAESGWVNWQGILYLLEKLTDGERPDVVIFYSGVNEAMSARLWPQVRRPLYDGEMTKAALTDWSLGEARPLARTWDYYRRTSLILSALIPPPARLPPAPPLTREALADRTANEYLADKQAVETLGNGYGFSTMFVWQLTVASKPVLSAQEQQYAGWVPRTPANTAPIGWWLMDTDLRSFYEVIGKRVSDGGAIDIGSAFVGMSQTGFIDWMHTAENGNERVAREIYRHLEQKLHQSTRHAQR